MIQDPVKQGQQEPIDLDRLALGGGKDLDGMILDGIEAARQKEATGLSWLGHQGLAALKMFGESMHELGQFGPAGQLTRMMPESMQGQGFLGAVEAAGQGVNAMLGETPDLNLTWNEAANKHLDEKLWNSRVIGDTAGYLASFVTGPGAALGRGGAAAASKLAGPMSKMVQRGLMRKVASEGLEDATKVALANGETNAWKLLAQDPNWKKVASKSQVMAAWAGRNLDDMISATGANVLQSYALSPEERKNEEALFSLLTPVFLPLARVGERAGSALAGFRMRPETQAKIANITSEIIEGKIDPRQARKLISELDDAPAVRRALAEAVASSFEAAAFMGFQGQNWRDLRDVVFDGDSAAMDRLVGTFMGSAIGIAVGKYGVGHEEATFFRRVRPDLNTLKTFAEAEAARQQFEQSQAKPADSVPQEPKKTGLVDELPRSTVERMAMDKMLGQRKQRLTDASQQTADQVARDRAADLERRTREILTRSGWADPEATPLLRSGWTPTNFGDDGSVSMQFGRDDALRIRQENGQLELQLDPRTLSLLEQAGRRHDHEVLSPTMVRLRGEPARQALESLALYGHAVRMRAANRFESLGYREAADGVWHDPNTGEYHVPTLDGGSAIKHAMDQGWDGVRDDLPMPVRRGQTYTSIPLDTLEGWLASKSQIAPEPLVDTLIGQSIEMAKSGTSQGAHNVRVLIDSIPPAMRDALLGPGGDKFLALQLAEVAQGGSPQRAMDELVGHWRLQEVRAGTREIDPVTGTIMSPDLQLAGEVGAIPTDRPAATVRSAEIGPVVNMRPGLVDPRPMPPSQDAPAPTGPRAQVSPDTANMVDAIGRASSAEPPPAGLQPAPDAAADPQRTTSGPESGPRTIADDLNDIAALRAKSEAEMQRDVEAQAGSMNPVAGLRATKAQLAKERAQEYGRSIGEKASDTYFVDQPKVIGKLAGDREFADLGREAMSLDRTLKRQMVDLEVAAEGAVKAAKSEMTGIRVDPTYANWGYNPARVAVEQGPWSPTSARVAETFNQAGSRLWTMNRDAGVLRDTAEGPRPMEGDGGKVLPRLTGKDAAKVFRSDRLLPKLADELYNHPEHGYVRRDFENAQALYDKVLKPMADIVGQGESIVYQNAIEKMRYFKRMPDQWTSGGKGYELFETRPLELLSRMANQQTTRAAVVATFGPDNATPEVREALGITKPGITHYLNRVIEKLSQRGADGAAWVDKAKAWAEQIQTQAPTGRNALVDVGMKAARWKRAAQTPFAFIHDVADVASTAGMIGTRRLTGGLLKFFKMAGKDPRRLLQHAEMTGTLGRKMGELAVSEAHGTKNMFLDALSFLSSTSERFKASAQTAIGEHLVDTWKKGKGDAMDSIMLAEQFGYSPEQASALVNGQASPQLERRFVHEYVQRVTGQKRPAEGSVAGANQTVNLLADYQRFHRSRLPMLAKVATTLAKGWANPKTRGAAMVRSLEAVLGVTLSSQVGIMLSAGLSQLFRGDEGLKQYWNALWSSQEDFVKALGSGYRQALVGGPAEAALRGFDSPRGRSNMFNVNVFTSVIGALADTYQTPGGMAQKAWTFAKQAPIIPIGSKIEGAATAVRVAMEGGVNSRANSAIVGKFRELNGMPSPPLVEPSKESAFYDALGKVRKVVEANYEDPDAAFAKAQEVLQDAIGAESKKSLVDSLRAMRNLSRGGQQMDVQDLDRLRKWIGADRFAEVYAWDNAIEDFANLVSKHMEDPSAPSEFRQNLEAASNLAQSGSRNSFEKILPQLTEEAIQQYQMGGGLSEQIREFADAVAPFPDAVARLLPKSQAERVRMADPTYNSIAVQRMLIQRIQSRARAEVREEAQQAR